MNKRKLDPDFEIYSQFSGKPTDLVERYRTIANPTINSYDEATHGQVLESLKNNEFFDNMNFEVFLHRKNNKGIRTKFLNRVTQENAKELGQEYLQQAKDN